MIKSVLIAAEFKEQAKSLQARLREIGVELSLQQAYEGLSASYGARNWHTMKAEALQQAVPPRMKHNIHLFMDFWSDDEYLELPEFAYIDLSKQKTWFELWKTKQLCLSGVADEAIAGNVTLSAIAENVRSKYEDCCVDRQSFWFTSQSWSESPSARTNSIYFDTICQVMSKGVLPTELSSSDRYSLLKAKDNKGNECLLLFWSNHGAARLKYLVGKAVPCSELEKSFDCELLLKTLND